MEWCNGVLVHRMKCTCSSIVMVKRFCAMSQINPKLELFCPPWIRTDPIMAVVLEPQWQLNPIGYWFSQSLLKSCLLQQRFHWHGSNLKLYWASEQFCIQLLLPQGTLTSACFLIAMYSWFEWLCGSDQELFLHVESELWVLEHSLPFVALPLNFCSIFMSLGTVGIHWEDVRWPELGRGAGWRRAHSLFSSGDCEPSQCGFGLPKQGLAAVSLNLSNLRQSWIQAGTELNFASLESSFGSFADPGVLTSILDSIRSIDDYAHTLLIR